MGAEQFTTTIKVSKETTDHDAFVEARDGAKYENGHGGYTGSIAEKNNFIMIHRARNAENANRIVDAFMGGWDVNISPYRTEAMQMFEDKWGDAGAVRYPVDNKTDEIIFFGWASC
jgi:hypothetical protein